MKEKPLGTAESKDQNQIGAQASPVDAEVRGSAEKISQIVTQESARVDPKRNHLYDAAAMSRLIGISRESSDPVPEAAEGEIVVYYGGWSSQELRDSPLGKRLMDQDRSYDRHEWVAEKLPSGMYRLRIPVEGSNKRTVAEQEHMLPAGETTAPVVLVATALLAHYSETGQDLLNGASVRCKEQTFDIGRVGLVWHGGRLQFSSYWDDVTSDTLLLSSVRE